MIYSTISKNDLPSPYEQQLNDRIRDRDDIFDDNYNKYVKWRTANNKDPNIKSDNDEEKKLAKWLKRQRETKVNEKLTSDQRQQINKLMDLIFAD